MRRRGGCFEDFLVKARGDVRGIVHHGEVSSVSASRIFNPSTFAVTIYFGDNAHRTMKGETKDYVSCIQ
jgi:hypothetical protein